MANGDVRPLLDIIGVDADGVGTPRNDGGPGSALYRVPIQLNRQPDGFESRLLVQLWNHPPSFSTMHRPGIMTVSGDRLVLNGTTIDEVAEVHSKTLRLIIDETNRLVPLERARQVQLADQAERESAERAGHVREVAGEIKF
ncbi:MAG: hypothetical protein ACR2NT_14700 [Acidimicrobiia bacterium]